MPQRVRDRKQSVASKRTGRRVVARLCLAEVLSMAGAATFPALLPLLVTEWDLSHAQAGLVSGIFLGGYMAAVPLLTSLTDRIDARRVYFAATLLSACGALGFALFARGFGSALVLQMMAGAGLAGTYMPGLKLLAQEISGPQQSRMVAFYTSTFGVGTGLSLWWAGTAATLAGWRWAFGLAALGPLLAGAIVILGFPAKQPRWGDRPTSSLLDFRPVVRNREALGYIVGYAAHCWELFGFRSWIVAFLAFVAGYHSSAGAPLWSAATLAAVINLLGPVASIAGNEAAAKVGRQRVVRAITALSIVGACLVGFSGVLAWYLVFPLATFYFLVIMGDSATLTAGVVTAAEPSRRGATMAVHSLLGFGAGFLAPAVFGIVLDRAGGAGEPRAWGLAFGSLALGYAFGPLPLSMLRARTRRQRVG